MSRYQMEATTVHDNYRIEVVPERVYFRTDRKTEHEYRLMELTEAKAGIERHVDGLESVTVAWDTKQVCSHCRVPVEDAMTSDGPGCCDQAVELYETWKAARFTGPGYDAHPGYDHEDCCK